MRSADTDRDTQERQVAVWRAMAPAERVAQAVAMSEEAFAAAAAGIRARHPDYEDAQVEAALRRLRVGD